MKSIGSILLAARKKEGYTIEDIHRTVKIHPKYIKALEKDDYSIFEGKVHAKGFLKIYAGYLQLDLSEMLALWRREFEPFLEDKEPTKLFKVRALEPEKFFITPGVLILALVTVMLTSFFIFLFIQYREYTGAPSLEIFHPIDNYATEQDILDITGRVDLDSEVFINNQKIISNPDGSFLTSIKLREGINTISVKAVNKLNKETELLRTIIYRPVKPEPEIKELPSENLLLDGSSGLEVTEYIPQENTIQ